MYLVPDFLYTEYRYTYEIVPQATQYLTTYSFYLF